MQKTIFHLICYGAWANEFFRHFVYVDTGGTINEGGIQMSGLFYLYVIGYKSFSCQVLINWSHVDEISCRRIWMKCDFRFRCRAELAIDPNRFHREYQNRRNSPCSIYRLDWRRNRRRTTNPIYSKMRNCPGLSRILLCWSFFPKNR